MTDWAFSRGYIGLSEYVERGEILAWLMNSDDSAADPRRDDGSPSYPLPSRESHEEPMSADPVADGSGTDQRSGSPDNPPLDLIPKGLRNNWVFTKDDPDFYPSVPHGHLNNKTNAWPKLNPYTGRAYAKKESEDEKFRLQKREMITLWNDPKFRQHALETIAWYMTEFPHFEFPVRNPLRLPRWRPR